MDAISAKGVWVGRGAGARCAEKRCSDRRRAGERFGLRREAVVAWLPLVVAPGLVYGLTVVYGLAVGHVAGWVLMWLLAGAIFFCFKWLAWRRCERPAAAFGRKIAWWLAWVRMDPAAFLGTEPLAAELRPTRGEWGYAAGNVAGGVLLWVLGSLCVRAGWTYAGGWCGMVGLVLLLHFGLFHGASCLWRAAGVKALPLMDHPLRATSLGEFWGRRWNRGFHDTAYVGVFRPIAKRRGTVAAMLGVFLFSGVVHEAGISLPAGGGYGLPTIYFLLQGAMLLVQSSTLGKRAGLRRGWRGRAVTMGAVLLPAPMLFHPWFVERVIVPMLRFWIRQCGSPLGLPVCLAMGPHPGPLPPRERETRLSEKERAMKEYLPTMILIAGLAQWSVLVASATVPIQLKWRQTFAALPKLHRQLVWTYALYIFASIFALGLVCVALHRELAQGGPLALAIFAYGAAFWGIRLALQGVFDVQPYLTATWLRLGYHTLTMLFVSFVAVYGAALVWSW